MDVKVRTVTTAATIITTTNARATIGHVRDVRNIRIASALPCFVNPHAWPAAISVHSFGQRIGVLICSRFSEVCDQALWKVSGPTFRDFGYAFEFTHEPVR